MQLEIIALTHPDTGEKRFINLAHIVSFHARREGGSGVFVQDGFLRVKESPEETLRLLS